MLISLFSGGDWHQLPRASARRGSNDNIFYVTIPASALDALPEGQGALRVALDDVECLAVSPLGPSADGHSMEFIVVMPSDAVARKLRESV